MRTPILAGVLFLLPAATSLETDYGRPRTLRTEVESAYELETTSSELELDGEPVDHGFGGDGSGSSASHRIVTVDRVVERDGARPRLVHRTFVIAEGSSEAYFGDRSFDRQLSSPLAGTTLAIAVDEDGDVYVSVEDGDRPDDDRALEGHRATLALDALLPSGAVEEGETWDVEPADVAHALGLDLRDALFPPPEPEGGERDRGRRMFGSALGFLEGAEWEGEATLASIDDEWEGTPCVRIDVTLEASGHLEPMIRAGMRGGRRALAAPRVARDNTYEAEIEGSVYWSTELARPVAAELEGTLELETLVESSAGEREMRMRSTREGTFELRIVITEESAE